MSSRVYIDRNFASTFVLLAALILGLNPWGASEAIATLPGTPSAADLVPLTDDGQMPILIEGADAVALTSLVEELGGRVTHVFDNIDALAATLPPGAMSTLLEDSRVQFAARQRLLHRAVVTPRLPEPISGLNPVEMECEVVPLPTAIGTAHTRTIPLSNVPRVLDKGRSEISSFLGYDIITGAAESWEAADYGEGVIVSVIDTGIYPFHPLYFGNVIGGINLVPPEAEMEIDYNGDGVPDGLSFDWDAVENHYHGTFVAGLIAGHMDLVMPEDDPFVQSVAFHSPESVEFYGDGTAAIHLMGTAPAASLYGVKVFPYDGSGVPDVWVLDAIDLLIDMRMDGTLETDVINMSLSGPVLNDGRYFLDRIVDVATEAGITVVSAAANDGPALISVGTPGSAFTSLTAGGAVDPLHTRVAFELFFGAPPGTGNIIYPEDELYIVDFSSRGLTADKRVKPDIVATGFLTFSATLEDISGDGLNDAPGFGFGSGTSFSTPTIAGAAALVTAFARNEGSPFAGPPYVANALRRGAQPIDDFHDTSQREQGRGFVNIPQAFDNIRNGAAQSPGPVIKAHHAMRRLSVASGFAQGETPLLDPGKSYNFFIDVPENIGNLAFEITDVTLGTDQNPIFGDGMAVTVHSAKRGGSGDYVYGAFPVMPGETFDYEFPEPGTVRLTVLGNFINYSPGSVAFEVTAEPIGIAADHHFEGRLEHDEMVEHVVDVPEDLAALAIRLSWKHDWTRFPTYDLNLIIDSPSGIYPVWSLNSPELALIEAPDAGEWTFLVMDAGTVDGREPYDLELAFIPAGGPMAENNRGRPQESRPEVAVLETELTGGGSSIQFTVPQAGPVRLQVFDVTGRLVRTLASGPMEAGEHQISWEGKSDAGSHLSSGIYFLRLGTEMGKATRKMFLR
jgi:subtilisin family serine protease